MTVVKLVPKTKEYLLRCSITRFLEKYFVLPKSIIEKAISRISDSRSILSNSVVHLSSPLNLCLNLGSLGAVPPAGTW